MKHWSILIFIGTSACASTVKERWGDNFPWDAHRGGRLEYAQDDFERAKGEASAWCGEGREPLWAPDSTSVAKEKPAKQRSKFSCIDPKPHREIYRFTFDDVPRCEQADEGGCGPQRYAWMRNEDTVHSCDAQGWLMRRDGRYVFVGSNGLETCKRMAAEAASPGANYSKSAQWLDRRLKPCDSPVVRSSQNDVGVVVTLPQGFRRAKGVATYTEQKTGHRGASETFGTTISFVRVVSLPLGDTAARTREEAAEAHLRAMNAMAKAHAQEDGRTVDAFRLLFWDGDKEIGAYELVGIDQQEKNKPAEKWVMRILMVRTLHGSCIVTLQVEGEPDAYLETTWTELVNNVDIRKDVAINNSAPSSDLHQ